MNIQKYLKPFENKLKERIIEKIRESPSQFKTVPLSDPLSHNRYYMLVFQLKDYLNIIDESFREIFDEMKKDLDIELIKKNNPFGRNDYLNIPLWLTEEEYTYIITGVVCEGIVKESLINNIIERIFYAIIDKQKRIPAELYISKYSQNNTYFLVLKKMKRIFIYDMKIEKRELFKKNFTECFLGLSDEYKYTKYKNDYYYPLFRKLSYLINSNKFKEFNKYGVDVFYDPLNTYANISSILLIYTLPSRSNISKKYSFKISLTKIHKTTDPIEYYYNVQNINNLNVNDVELIINTPYFNEMAITNKRCNVKDIDSQIEFLQLLKKIKQNNEVKEIVLELIKKRNVFRKEYKKYFNDMYNEIKEIGITLYIVKRKYNNKDFLFENVFEFFEPLI